MSDTLVIMLESVAIPSAPPTSVCVSDLKWCSGSVDVLL